MATSTLPSGTISSAVGSFPIVTGIAGENTNGVGNSFSLQLNTDSTLMNPQIRALCNATSNPSACTGWVQFVYWQGEAQIWYNLLHAGDDCPWSDWDSTGGTCFYKAPNTLSIPGQDIHNLQNMSVTAVAGKGIDSVTVATAPGTLYAVANGSIFNLATSWKQADFNVVGSDSLAKAHFDGTTTIAVKLITYPSSGSSAAAICNPPGTTTGETNNLSTVKDSCCTIAGTAPGIVFTESYSDAGPILVCPVITSVSPSQGTSAGGATVTIQGSGFSVADGATQFTFDKLPATNVHCTSSTTCTATTPGHPASSLQFQSVPIAPTVSGLIGVSANDYTYEPQPRCAAFTRTSTGVEAACATFLPVYVQANVSGAWQTVGTGTPGGGGSVDIVANTSSVASTTFRTCSDYDGVAYCNVPQNVPYNSCVPASCDTVPGCGTQPNGCGGTMTCYSCGNGTVCMNGACVATTDTGSFCKTCRSNGGACEKKPTGGWICMYQ